MAARTVRDREAPGSNPGPPTKIRIRSRRRAWCWEGAGSQPYHNFSPAGDLMPTEGDILRDSLVDGSFLRPIAFKL